jgi:hypothetical protein
VTLIFFLPATSMSIFRKISFTDLCLNGQMAVLNLEEGMNKCELSHFRGR